MSLMRCKECGKEFSSTAKACPHCGHAPYQPSGCLVLTIGFFIVLAGAGLAPSCGRQTAPTPYTPTAEDAAAACRTAIKVVLNDADSAQFDPPTGAAQNADGTWTAQRTLRAKNAFGAYRRAVFECKLAPNGDGTWRGLDVKQLSP